MGDVQVTRIRIIRIARGLGSTGQLNTAAEKEEGGRNAGGECGGGTEAGAYWEAGTDCEVDGGPVVVVEDGHIQVEESNSRHSRLG